MTNRPTLALYRVEAWAARVAAWADAALRAAEEALLGKE